MVAAVDPSDSAEGKGHHWLECASVLSLLGRAPLPPVSSEQSMDVNETTLERSDARIARGHAYCG